MFQTCGEHMSRKSDKKGKQNANSNKSPKNDADRKTGREGYGKIRAELPKNLQERVESENNPDEIIAEALSNYYGGRRLRNEIAVQKEIDNNIIEIQRRHISDLKEQLVASNKNYEELMKTYQAYMFQVQPLIENAKLSEAERLVKISAPGDETKAESEKTKTENEKTKAESEETKNESEETKNENGKRAEPVTAQAKTKKWYEFWK